MDLTLADCVPVLCCAVSGWYAKCAAQQAIRATMQLMLLYIDIVSQRQHAIVTAIAAVTATAGGLHHSQHELSSGLPPPCTPHSGPLLPYTGPNSAAAQSLPRVWRGQLSRGSSSRQQQQQRRRGQSRGSQSGCGYGPHIACPTSYRCVLSCVFVKTCYVCGGRVSCGCLKAS
jgi:hypothetical protein